MSEKRPAVVDVPSKQMSLLKSLKGAKLKQMTRYSLDSPERAAADWDIPLLDVFQLTEGPLSITLDSGLSLGFNSEPGKASLVVWMEGDSSGTTYGESLAEDKALSPIKASEENYCNEFIRQLLGKQIDELIILKKEPTNSKMAQLPCEAGLLIVFENGTRLVLSHGLHDNSDDFAVVAEKDIEKDVMGSATKIDI